MKKYVKPMIVFESFTLSTNIAANCKQKADGYTNFYDCGVYFESEGQVFTTPWNGCEVKADVDDPDKNGEYNGYCYDVPTGATPLFNS